MTVNAMDPFSIKFLFKFPLKTSQNQTFVDIIRVTKWEKWPEMDKKFKR